MKNIFKTKYRIVRHAYAGYYIQHKDWWFPFWVDYYDGIISFSTVEEARECIDTIKYAGQVVEYYQPNQNKK